MRSRTCVLVVVCVAHKLCPCPSYSRCRDRINLVLWRSLYKGGGVQLWDSWLLLGDSVSVQWVPSHVGMEGNERADQRSKSFSAPRDGA